MSTFPKIFPDDPRLTAFALGELEGEDLAAVEAALRDDPAARAAVEEIRAMAGHLETALGAEAAADAKAAIEPLHRAAILPGRDPAKLDGGSMGKLLQFPKLRFPQLYYIVGGLAAAAFAVLVMRQERPEYRVRQAEKKTYAAVELQARAVDTMATNAAINAPALAEPKDADKLAEPVPARKRDEPAPTVAAVTQEQAVLNAPAQSSLLKAMPQVAGAAAASQSFAANERRADVADMTAKLQASAAQDGERAKSFGASVRPAPMSTVLGPVSGGTLAKEDEKQVLSAFTVTAEKDEGYLKARTGTPTRIGGEIQRAPLAVEIKSDPGKLLAPPASGVRPEAFLRADAITPTREGREAQLAQVHSLPSIPADFAGKPAGAAHYLDAKGNKIYDTNVGVTVPVSVRAKSPANTEAYAYQRDNDFLGAAENPLSTFSIDVDTASYANVRRFLAEGQLPPADAVRIEELVNYFPYHYAPPAFAEPTAGRPAADATGKALAVDPFAASMEVSDAPWAAGHRLVRIGLKGREGSTAARAAANLVFLLDVSGSMDEPNKLPLVKESMRLLLGKLRPDDHVAIVVYAGASGLALPSTPVAQSREIVAALDSLEPGGSTNGAMGIQLAYDIAKANFVTGGINRVILCTDGDFNVGVTSEGDLTRLIAEKAKSGVFLTVFGFGMGNYKDATLEKLADQGNGNYGYIDSRREAEKLLVEQVNGTLVTIAKDVKIQVEFNPAQVASYRLIGYENRLLKKEDFNNDAVDAGEIGAGHTVTALYEVVPTSQARGEGPGAMDVPAVDPPKYQPTEERKSKIENRKSSELLTLKVRFKEPVGTVSRKLEFPLTDAGTRFANASGDFKFTAAVAEFGMILRGSPHKGTGTLGDVQAWAEAGTDGDAGGYRSEFIGLVKQAEALLK